MAGNFSTLSSILGLDPTGAGILFGKSSRLGNIYSDPYMIQGAKNQLASGQWRWDPENNVFHQLSDYDQGTYGLLNRIRKVNPNSISDAQAQALIRQSYNAGQGGEGSMTPYWYNEARANAYESGLKDYYDSWGDDLKFLQSSPIARKNTGGGNADLLTKELNALLGVAPGYSLKNKAGGNQEHISRLVPDLARFGVNSLFDIKSYQVPDPSGKGTTTVFYDSRNNRVLPREFGSSMKGKGGSDYYLNAMGPLSVPGTSWRDTSERDTIAGVLGVLSLGFAGPAMGALQGAGLSAAQAGALYGAGAGALQSAVTGQNALKGALVGGATGYLGGSIGSGTGQTNLAASLGVDNATAQAIVNGAIKAGGSAALQSAISGNNLGDSLLGGAIQGGVSGGLGQALGGGALNQYGAGAVGKMLANKLVPQDRKSTLSNQDLMNRRPLGVNIPQVRTSSGGSLSQGIANYQNLSGDRQGRVNSAIDKIFGDLAPVYKVRYS